MTSPGFLPRPKRRKLLVIRRVTGESMLPALAPGKVVLAVRSRRIMPNDVVIVQHKGIEKIKRVKYLHGDKVFVQGDNSRHSTDSRAFGLLDQTAVIAKVMWPRSKG